MDQVPNIVLTQFARARHTRESGRSYFLDTESSLLWEARGNWHNRRPGAGRTGLTEVVIVPMPAFKFANNTVLVTPTTPLRALLDRRQDGEEPFVAVRAEKSAPTIECRFAWVVCYHHDVLTEQERDGLDSDWYIVSLGASDVEDEPMFPLTMVRNQMGLPGGTKITYSSEEWARAVHYWSIRCQRDTA